MKMEDFCKIVFASFSLGLTAIVTPILAGNILENILPGSHLGIILPIITYGHAINLIVTKIKEKKGIPGPGDETPWDNDKIQDGGKI